MYICKNPAAAAHIGATYFKVNVHMGVEYGFHTSPWEDFSNKVRLGFEYVDAVRHEM